MHVHSTEMKSPIHGAISFNKLVKSRLRTLDLNTLCDCINLTSKGKLFQQYTTL